MEETPKSDLVIILDITSSMQPHIQACKNLLANYLIRSGLVQDIDNIGLVAFGDHPYCTCDYLPHTLDCLVRTDNVVFANKTSNLEEFVSWLHKLYEKFITMYDRRETIESSIWFGEDLHECISCAVTAAKKLSPKGRYWVITDSVWHKYQDRCASLHFNYQDINMILLTEEVDFYRKQRRAFLKNLLVVPTLTELLEEECPLFTEDEQVSPDGLDSCQRQQMQAETRGAASEGRVYSSIRV